MILFCSITVTTDINILNYKVIDCDINEFFKRNNISVFIDDFDHFRHMGYKYLFYSPNLYLLLDTGSNSYSIKYQYYLRKFLSFRRSEIINKII